MIAVTHSKSTNDLKLIVEAFADSIDHQELEVNRSARHLRLRAQVCIISRFEVDLQLEVQCRNISILALACF